MDEELFDPACGACERAQADYAELERNATDLAALVTRLAHALRTAAPYSKLPDSALDYLRQKKLLGSPLRKEQSNES